jgi:hypothetical protein
MQNCVLSILQSGNLYVAMLNNPVRFRDPTGLYVVDFIDYLRAMGATVNHIAPNNAGQARVAVTYDGRTQNWILNSGRMDNRDINAHFGWSDFLTEADRNHGVGIVITGGNLYRNVTAPVNAALAITASHAASRVATGRVMGVNIAGLFMTQTTTNMAWFYNQVKPGGPWDVKLLNSWETTIQSTFPGRFDTPIYFRGQRMTPESLGNWTYGYIGAALGLSLPVLLGGSWYADGFTTGEAFRNNELIDWGYVQRGFNVRSRR